MMDRAQERPVPWPVAWRLCTVAGRRPILTQIALAAVQAALPLAGLLAMRQLVDAVADGLAGRLPLAAATDAALLATVFAAAVAFAGGLLRSVTSVLAENHGRRLGDASVQRLQQHAARLDLADFDRPSFHDALQRAGSEAGQRPVRLVQDGIALLVAVLSLLLMAAVLAQVEPWLPLLVGTAAVPIAWVRRRHAVLRFAWQREHVAEQRDVAYLGGTLAGRATAKDVRVLGVAGWFGERLAGLRAGLRRSLAGLARRRARDELLVHTLASAGLFAAYVYLAYAALGGALTLGGLVLHAQAAQRTQNGVRDLLAASSGVTEHRLFLRPLVSFLARSATIESPPSADAAPAPMPAAPLALAAAALHFRYPESERDVLAGVDLAIAAGERVALVGANGSGKSTLIKLLCRLYDPQSGALTVNGQPLARLDAANWRRRLAVLLQDASAFELTLRENLQLGHVEPPADETLWQALRLVGLAERIAALPLALDTPWSRRHRGGVDWSVGEGRRLALARVLLQPADALLLDEPFAALDGRTAAGIAAHLAARPRGQTLVLVDHRGPALHCVDRVVWLDRGRVVAAGSPAEMAKRSDFAEQFPEWRPGGAG